MRLGTALVISAPSGAGKTTLIRKLTAEFPGFTYSISFTTRSPRAGEVNGRDYHFTTREDFIARRDRHEFAEWAEVHGNLYGTPLAPVLEAQRAGRDILFDIDVQGAAQLHLSLPSAHFVFILPPSMEELEKRLRGRGTETEESIRERLEIARNELAQQDKFTLKLVNDEVDACAARLYDVICQRAGLTR